MMFFGTNVLDLRSITGGSSGGSSSETDPYYTEIDWANGVPSEVRKYEDDTKAVLLFTITPTWTNGVPTQVVAVDEVNTVTTTTTITWTDGVPSSVTKVDS